MRDEGAKEGTLPAAWLQRWDLQKPQGNPPNILTIPRTFECLHVYALEWAYLGSRRQEETIRHFKRRVYGTLRSMAKAATSPRKLRVTPIQPGIEWEKVWNNLHSIPTSVGAGSAWYMVLQDLVHRNTRPHRIRLVETEDCTLRKEGYHGPQTHGMWGRRRNMGMDPYTAGGDTQNGPETHFPWVAHGVQILPLATTTISGDPVDPGEPRILPSA